MIEILLKNKEFIKVNRPSEILDQNLDFHVMQFIDYTDEEINWVEEKFGVDFSVMKHYEDIEISSHFLSNDNEVSFHISIPYYDEDKKLIESPVFFIISSKGLFFFSNSGVDLFFNKTYSYKFLQLQQLIDTKTILKFQIEFISDYFADITESETKKVKALASTILLEKKFSAEVMDLITRYNFNNLLLKECLLETTRVFNLYKKSSWQQKNDIKETIESELNDLSVVSDYIQFNFDRLDDLKENVSNKIDLEQNHIFKTLTVVTVCISLPTFIAGLYGMNFENMPELRAHFGYPLAVIAMVFAAVLPYIYFKRKKWL
ncbi:CorA family divalent cation transporter [Flavobacterium granuli]|uniref:Magnesium transporter n=1 Tax=Flavobacterium granuli TaxID=280093 RepID=A0ABU1S3X7_9FLAO|nr:CorA family divalent cation transporter [Flavobacterium granuli]MDR6845325.1 magnesium transporter [Flavobacterium granuli]